MGRMTIVDNTAAFRRRGLSGTGLGVMEHG